MTPINEIPSWDRCWIDPDVRSRLDRCWCRRQRCSGCCCAFRPQRIWRRRGNDLLKRFPCAAQLEVVAYVAFVGDLSEMYDPHGGCDRKDQRGLFLRMGSARGIVVRENDHIATAK